MTPTIDTIVRFIIAVLFNGLWEAALLAIVAWLALRAMPNGNATTRHSVLVAALLASLILPVATAVVTTVHPAAPPVVTKAHAPQTLPVTAPSKTSNVAAPVRQTQSTPEIAPPPRAHIALPRPVALGIVVLWLLGALFVLVRLVLSLMHLERLKKDALPVAVEYRAQLARWNAATKGSRTVRLCRSGEIAIPIAVGLFDAMILIPERFLEELEPADVDRIVLHELAHLRRADDWINAIERLASALFFFNPGIAWLVAQLDLEREVACDDWVLQQNDPLPYANCLAKVVETAVWPYRAMSAPGAFLTRRAMSVRIERLLTAHRDVRVRTSLGPTGIVVAALAALGIGAAFVSPSFAYTVASPARPAAGAVAHHSIVERHIVRRAVTEPQRPLVAATQTQTVARVVEVKRQSQVVATATVAPVATATPSPAVKSSPHAAAAAAASASASAGAAAKTARSAKAVAAASTAVANAVRNSVAVGAAVASPQQLGANAPAYIDELASVGYTNLTVDQLVQMKAVGVTGDYIRGVENAGFHHPSVDDLVRLRALGVQPDYIRTMRQHYGALDLDDISRLKAVGVTPEYATQMANAGYSNLNAEQLLQLRAVGVDAAFIQRARAHGFNNLTVDQLINLKTSNIL